MALTKIFLKNGYTKDISICGIPNRDLYFCYNDIANTIEDLNFLLKSFPVADDYVIELRKNSEIHILEQNGHLAFFLKNGELFDTDDSACEFDENTPQKYIDTDIECPEEYHVYSFIQISQKKKIVAEGELEFLAIANLIGLKGCDYSVCIYGKDNIGLNIINGVEKKNDDNSEYVEDLNWLLT